MGRNLYKKIRGCLSAGHSAANPPNPAAGADRKPRRGRASHCSCVAGAFQARDSPAKRHDQRPRPGNGGLSDAGHPGMLAFVRLSSRGGRLAGSFWFPYAYRKSRPMLAGPALSSWAWAPGRITWTPLVLALRPQPLVILKRGKGSIR